MTTPAAPYDPIPAARAIAAAHRGRARFQNLSADIRPATLADAYRAQDALRDLWIPAKGAVVGAKIATTTKLAQEIMGIDHPCQGNVFERTVFASGATLDLGAAVHPQLECELCVRLGRDLDRAGPFTVETVRGAVATVMAAFEWIEDRHATLPGVDVATFVADNAWNAGVVLGPEVAPPAGTDWNGIAGRLVVDGREAGTGKTDGPLTALAWLAEHARSRGRPLRAGQFVMTGTTMVPWTILPGQRLVFTLDGVGAVEARAG